MEDGEIGTLTFYSIGLVSQQVLQLMEKIRPADVFKLSTSSVSLCFLILLKCIQSKMHISVLDFKILLISHQHLIVEKRSFKSYFLTSLENRKICLPQTGMFISRQSAELRRAALSGWVVAVRLPRPQAPSSCCPCQTLAGIRVLAPALKERKEPSNFKSTQKVCTVKIEAKEDVSFFLEIF